MSIPKLMALGFLFGVALMLALTALGWVSP